MGDRASTLVMGVGNLLMGDEGVGVHVAQRLLAGPRVPGGVELLHAVMLVRVRAAGKAARVESC